jgi:hypothetical protein
MHHPLNDAIDAPHFRRDAATIAAYLVSGSTGEYEMHHSWPVAVVSTQAEAEALQKAAQAVADQVFLDADSSYLDLADFTHQLNPFDPNMHFIDTLGVHYSVTQVPSLTDLPSLERALRTVREEFQARRTARSVEP